MEVRSVEIVDAQIHIWEPDHSNRRWNSEYDKSWDAFLKHAEPVTIDRAIGAMDAVGVNAAVLIPFLYPDINYEREAVARYPMRFVIVPPIDLGLPTPERQLEDYQDVQAVVGIRLVLPKPAGTTGPPVPQLYQRLQDGAFDPILTRARGIGYPVMLSVAGYVAEAGFVARRHPDIQIIVDHFGIVQGPVRQRPERPFADLDALLSLARFPNVALKLSGGPTLSDKAYPYRDLWPHIHRLIDAFGPERLMWGSDFTRTRSLHSYCEALGYLRYSDEISEHDKHLILGQSLRKLLGWPREAGLSA
jgi:L-fuconolactonase